MHRSLITVRYAKALLLKGKEDNQLNEIQGDIHIVENTFSENENLYDVIQQPTILPSKKLSIIHNIFDNRLQTTTVLEFISLVIKNKREYYLKDMFRNFIDLYNIDQGIKAASITTAVTLESEEEAVVKNFIKKNFNAREINLSVCVDRNIIGGFIIQVNDQLLDASVRRQLELIRKKFLQKEWI
ncbi:MAG: ATP synthase F1 subunit delta [Bacteroidales bacterium]